LVFLCADYDERLEGEFETREVTEVFVECAIEVLA